MTAQEAKNLSIEVWFYLRNHPECKSKMDLPKKIFDKIELFFCKCPLCAYFSLDCKECPLYYDGSKDCANGYFKKWCDANTNIDREFYADKILQMIYAWKI